MSAYDDFIKERIEIGSGRVAKVYSWNGYAYKCFVDWYSKEWIAFEQKQQDEVCKSNLPIPHYYACDFPNTIKMDLIPGISMGDKFTIAEKDILLDDFLFWFQKLHTVENLDLHSHSENFFNNIDSTPVTEEQKTYAKQCFAEVEQIVSEKNVLCHMDYHPLNIMYKGKDIYIIDWSNAVIGKQIWDYARTYIIFYEHVTPLLQDYLERVLSLGGYTEEVFMKAVYVNAIFRLNEDDTKPMRQLIETIFAQH